MSVFWILFWWVVLSFPAAILVGACIRYGMGGDEDREK